MRDHLMQSFLKFVDETSSLLCALFSSSTINQYFGSGIMTKNGIILNNEMADFSIPGVTKVDGARPPVVSRKPQPLIVYETLAAVSFIIRLW